MKTYKHHHSYNYKKRHNMLTSKIDTTGLGMLYELQYFEKLSLAYFKSTYPILG